MNEKWHLKNNNKKGFLKIHIIHIIAVNNIKTKKILSMKVTDDVEHVHYDSKALSGLVDDVIKSANRAQEQLEQLTNSLLMMELMMVMIFSAI